MKFNCTNLNWFFLIYEDFSNNYIQTKMIYCLFKHFSWFEKQEFFLGACLLSLIWYIHSCSDLDRNAYLFQTFLVLRIHLVSLFRFWHILQFSSLTRLSIILFLWILKHISSSILQYLILDYSYSSRTHLLFFYHFTPLNLQMLILVKEHINESSPIHLYQDIFQQ